MSDLVVLFSPSSKFPGLYLVGTNPSYDPNATPEPVPNTPCQSFCVTPDIMRAKRFKTEMQACMMMDMFCIGDAKVVKMYDKP